MSDISKVYGKSRSNGQRNGEETRGLREAEAKGYGYHVVSEKRRNLKDSTHVRTVNCRADQISGTQLVIGEVKPQFGAMDLNLGGIKKAKDQHMLDTTSPKSPTSC
jgi:hypothetical protein